MDSLDDKLLKTGGNDICSGLHITRNSDGMLQLARNTVIGGWSLGKPTMMWAPSLPLNDQELEILFGQHYSFINGKLHVLDTAVGNQLLAAINDIVSNNPAQWCLCALGCRNVVLSLGTILWKVSIEEVPNSMYQPASGEPIKVRSNCEKNKLLAYIDQWGIRKPDSKRMLEDAKVLVRRVYNQGSSGKSQISRNKTQQLLRDTFEMIDLL